MVKPIPKSTLLFGRKLRKNLTVWESKLWRHLEDKNLGVRFKRQVYIGGYLVDFCCPARKLVIEIDGGYHKTLTGKDNDQLKNTFLKREGYKVLRFWNSEIDKDINSVLERIIRMLKQ